MIIHGGQVLSSYTHVSDQHSTFGTKVIVPTAREAHYVLDDFLSNATDLPVFGCWGDLLRMAGSLKYGQATASLIVGKWSASSRQNTLAVALKEWGTPTRPSRHGA